MILYLYAPTLRKVIGLRINPKAFRVIKTMITIGVPMQNTPIVAKRINVKNPHDITEGFEEYEVRHFNDGWRISKKVELPFDMDKVGEMARLLRNVKASKRGY